MKNTSIYTVCLWDANTLKAHFEVTNQPYMAGRFHKAKKIKMFEEWMGMDRYPEVIYVTPGDQMGRIERACGHLKRKSYWKLEPEIIDALDHFEDVTNDHISPRGITSRGTPKIDKEWIEEKKLFDRVSKHVDKDLQRIIHQKTWHDVKWREYNE